jgi:transposase
VTDRRGIPLAARLTGANVHNSTMLADMLDAIPSVGGKPGRPQRRPNKCHTDKGYDYPRCRDACRQRGILPRIAPKGIESKEKLGRYRWVVERTFAWLNRFRRLTIRYERSADIHHALTTLACLFICLYPYELCIGGLERRSLYKRSMQSDTSALA